MPKSTNIKMKVVGIRVPEKEANEYAKFLRSKVLEKMNDELFLYIRDYPQLTIDKVLEHFHGRRFINRRSIISMCEKTGLKLWDYPTPR